MKMEFLFVTSQEMILLQAEPRQFCVSKLILRGEKTYIRILINRYIK